MRERTAINLTLQELTDGAITSVDQNARFLAAINARGHSMTTMNKRAVAQVLAHKPDDYVRQLLELRQEGARACGQQVQAHAGLRLAARRSHARHVAHVWRRDRTMEQARPTTAKPEKERERPTALGRRFGSQRRPRRYRPLWRAAGAARRHLPRHALCAAPGMELMSGDFSAIESVVLAWLAGEQWKLDAYRTFFQTGDTTHRALSRDRPQDARPGRPTRRSTAPKRALGKAAELASGFGGGVGAWRRIMPNDARADDEIKAIIHQWRTAHPAVVKFWKDLFRAIRVAIRIGQPVLVAPRRNRRSWRRSRTGRSG